MARTTHRWPIWKIFTAMVGTALAGGAFAWLSTVVESITPAEAPGQQTTLQPAGMSLASLLFIFALACGMLTLLCGIWLIHRWRGNTPAWKRPGKIRPKRR